MASCLVLIVCFFDINDVEFYEKLDISEWWNYTEIHYNEYYPRLALTFYDNVKNYIEKLTKILSNLNQSKNIFKITYNTEKYYRFKEQYHSLKLEFNFFH